MPAFHRSFNPYSTAPPPPASLPYYTISPSSIEPLTNEQAGLLIDNFLQTQDGKVLTLHRLADHLLGRTHAPEPTDVEVEELQHDLEERRREGTVVQIQPDGALDDDATQGAAERGQNTQIPEIVIDKKKARKEERRQKKEKEREKRKREENSSADKEGAPESKKAKKDKERKKRKQGLGALE